MSAFLPQHDPHTKRRQAALRKARREYRYNYTHVSPLAMIEHVPFRDGFSIGFLKSVVTRLLQVMANRVEVEGDPHFRAVHDTRRNILSRMLRAVSIEVTGLIRLIHDTMTTTACVGRPESFDNYAELFREIGLPPICENYRSDSCFATSRVAGANPVVLQRIFELDDRFPVTEADYQATLPEDRLESAAKEGRLFLADYQLLECLENSSFPVAQKYVYAPLALFALEPTTRQLVPVAIQCSQTPAPDNPVFTPQDGYNWLIAKTIVEIADASYHEAITHLGQTHIFMEPFAIATHRQLAPHHPLCVLLRPHFEGTFAINKLAHAHLLAEDGPGAMMIAATMASTKKLTVSQIKNYSIQDALLPRTFVARGVDDPEVLPDYPYRDDTLMYWKAIHTWVDNYLAVYYPTAEDLQQDSELRAWCLELVDENGGRVAGINEGNSIETRNQLSDVIATIIHTCSVQHAAVNFPQYDIMSYAPMMPMAGYAPAPTSKTGCSEEDYLAMLPPIEMAELQMNMTTLLGNVRYSQLGQYSHHYFRDPRVEEHLHHFQGQLAEIGHLIDERNEQRDVPYETLKPAGIPQSINI